MDIIPESSSPNWIRQNNYTKENTQINHYIDHQYALNKNIFNALSLKYVASSNITADRFKKFCNINMKHFTKDLKINEKYRSLIEDNQVYLNHCLSL